MERPAGGDDLRAVVLSPLTQSLNSLSGTWGDQWFLQSAGTFISILVPLIVFFLLQRFFVRGLLAGATKG